MLLQHRLDKMDTEQEEDDAEVEAMQLTREEMEQMLGKSPLHTELKNQLDKVSHTDCEVFWADLMLSTPLITK